MISTVIDLVFKVRDVVENTPIQVMMIAAPLTIIVLAAISSAATKLIETMVVKK